MFPHQHHLHRHQPVEVRSQQIGNAKFVTPDSEVVPMPKRYADKARALILLAAFISFLLSVGLYFLDNETRGIFVGLWVPSILALGALILPPRQGPKQ
jgi:hypothetical protein